MRLSSVKWVILSALVIGLSACGGGNSSDSGGDSSNDSSNSGDNDGDQANNGNDSQILQQSASDDDFIEAYKTRLRRSVSTAPEVFTGLVLRSAIDDEESLADAPESAGNATGADNSRTVGFSQTNRIVETVDESDFVKYDGRYVYSYQSNYDPQQGQQSKLAVYDAEPLQPDLIGALDLSTSALARMYLRQSPDSDNTDKQIIAVSTNNFFYPASRTPGIIAIDATNLPVPESIKTQITRVDGLPVSPEVSATLSFDGSLLASRVIDNRMVIVTSHLPFAYNQYYNQYWGDFTHSEQSAEDVIDELVAADILPGYTLSRHGLTAGQASPEEADAIDQGLAQEGAVQEETGLLADPTDCFVLNRDEVHYGAPQILTISTVDLDSFSVTSSTCTTSYAGAFFISRNSLYLTDFNPGGTLIHKFALTEAGASYRGSGEVAGYVRGGEYSFHLYEQGDSLFALSSFWEGESFQHRFTVLQEDEAEPGKLVQVAQLPNAEQPATIGKPGEDIFGVRFFNDTAYVVTFERIDPLYTIDISDPLRPSIVGELELPGVSEYLHPISDSLLLGVGHNGQWPQEIQINLFDVSDKTQPALITQQKLSNYQGAWSSLFGDHHAFAAFVQKDGQSTRAAFPFAVFQGFEDDVVFPDEEVALPDDEQPLPEDEDDNTIVMDSQSIQQRRFVTLLDIDHQNQVMAPPRVKGIEAEQAYSTYQRILIDGEQLIYVDSSHALKLSWD